MWHQIFRLRPALLFLACVVALAGCNETLFSNLDETEANEMVAVLAAAGVDATRSREKDNVYEIRVHGSNVAVATTILRKEGFPKPKYQSLGDVFGNDSLASTPFEQHARYLFAINEELSRTISTISGVNSARVFVTSPPKDRYTRGQPKASASVSINYEPSFNVEAEVYKIKTIVAHSVSNLDYDRVAVALFETKGPSVRVKPDSEAQSPVTASVIGQLDIPADELEWMGIALFAGFVSTILGLVLIALRSGRLVFHPARQGSDADTDGSQ